MIFRKERNTMEGKHIFLTSCDDNFRRTTRGIDYSNQSRNPVNCVHTVAPVVKV